MKKQLTSVIFITALVLSVFVGLYQIPFVSAESLFSDGFESGTTAWTSSGHTINSGTTSGQASGTGYWAGCIATFKTTGTVTRVNYEPKVTTLTTSLIVACNATPTEGNVLIAGFSSYKNANCNITSIVQTGVTWAKQTQNIYNWDSSFLDTEIWLGVIGSGASDSINFTLSASSYGATAVVCEYNNVATTDFLDKTASNQGSTDALTFYTDTGTTAAITDTDELCIGVTTVQKGVNQTAPTNGFTLIDGVVFGTSNTGCCAYLEKIVSYAPAGDVTTDYAHSGSYSYEVVSAGTDDSAVYITSLDADTVYVRACFAFTGLANLDTNLTLSYVSDVNSINATKIGVMNVTGDVYWFMQNLETGDVNQLSYNAIDGQWYQVEYMRTVGNGWASIYVWINGLQMFGSDVEDVTNNAVKLTVGLPDGAGSSTDIGTHIYIDDVQAGTTYNNVLSGGISLPAHISTSGSYWLNQSFTGVYAPTERVLSLAADDIVFDGQNNLVTVTNNASANCAVYVNPANTNITVQNLSTTGGFYGLYADSASGITFINNTVDGVGANGHGINVNGATGDVIVDCTVKNVYATSTVGIWAKDTTNLIVNNTITENNLIGMYIAGNTGLQILSHQSLGDTNGVISDTSGDSWIIDNSYFSGNNYATNIGGSDNFNITNTQFVNSAVAAFFGYNTTNVIFDNVTLTGEITNVKVLEDQPIGLYFDYNCVNNTVTNSVLNNTFVAVLIASSSGLTVTNNMFGNDSGDGLCVYSTDLVTVTNNTFIECGFWDGGSLHSFAGGVELANCNATVTNNTFIGNYDAFMWGFMDPSNSGHHGISTVTDNIFQDNVYTLMLEYYLPQDPDLSGLNFYNNSINDLDNLDPYSYQDGDWQYHLDRLNVNFLNWIAINGVPINEIASIRGVPLLFMKTSSLT